MAHPAALLAAVQRFSVRLSTRRRPLLTSRRVAKSDGVQRVRTRIAMGVPTTLDAVGLRNAAGKVNKAVAVSKGETENVERGEQGRRVGHRRPPG